MDFDYRQYIPPSVPSEQNFAHTPLLKPLYNVEWNGDRSKILKENNPNGKARAMRFLAGIRYSQTQRRKGRKKTWDKGQARDLEAWQASFRDDGKLPVPDMPGDPAQDVIFAFGKFAAGMEELSRAVDERPLCRFDFPYDHRMDVFACHTSIVLNISLGLTLRASAYLQANEPGRAFRDVRTGIKIITRTKDDPLLISALSKVFSISRLQQPIWEALR